MGMQTVISRNISIIATASILLFSINANAAVGLFNTGVDDSGNVLALGSVDSHYNLSSGSAVFAVHDAEGYPGYWLAPNQTSSWITPLLGSGNTGSASAGSFYSIVTSFDLTDIDLSVFNLIGKVTADNGIDDVLVNGSSTGFKYGDPNSGVYGAFTNLLITSGFHTGVNTLTFNILSSAGPVGLRTDFSGTTFTPAVPEAETLAMLLTGLGVMTLSLRSRKHKRT